MTAPSVRTFTSLATGTTVERLVSAIPGEHGVCTRHRDKALMRGTFTWGRHAHSMYGGGLETFPAYRHADGTPCFNGAGEQDGWVQSYTVPTCAACGAQGDDLFAVRLEAYGDRVTCTACGHERWYSIGD